MVNGKSDFKLGQLDQAVIDIRCDLAIIKKEIRNLNAWKWKTVGIVSGIVIAGNIAADTFLKINQ